MLFHSIDCSHKPGHIECLHPRYSYTHTHTCHVASSWQPQWLFQMSRSYAVHPKHPKPPDSQTPGMRSQNTIRVNAHCLWKHTHLLSTWTISGPRGSIAKTPFESLRLSSDVTTLRCAYIQWNMISADDELQLEIRLSFFNYCTAIGVVRVKSPLTVIRVLQQD